MNDAGPEVGPLLDRLEQSLRAELRRRQIETPLMIGIHTGGAWIAHELHRRLALPEPLGELNIAFYRDDFSQIGMHPRVIPSRLPVSVDGRAVILIDDVLYTGRTIRAALNELFDYGRPAQVLLAVLIDRNGREIPIQPDCAGVALELAAGERIKLVGPNPLSLQIKRA